MTTQYKVMQGRGGTFGLILHELLLIFRQAFTPFEIALFYCRILNGIYDFFRLVEFRSKSVQALELARTRALNRRLSSITSKRTLIYINGALTRSRLRNDRVQLKDHVAPVREREREIGGSLRPCETCSGRYPVTSRSQKTAVRSRTMESSVWRVSSPVTRLSAYDSINLAAIASPLPPDMSIAAFCINYRVTMSAKQRIDKWALIFALYPSCSSSDDLTLMRSSLSDAH